MLPAQQIHRAVQVLSYCSQRREPVLSFDATYSKVQGCADVLFVWHADQEQTHQADSVSLPKVLPGNGVYRTGDQTLVHVVFHSRDSVGRQSPDPLQSLRTDLEVLAGNAGADYGEDHGSRGIASGADFVEPLAATN